MSLAIACFCSGAANGCSLVSLNWHTFIENDPSPTGKVCIATATLATTGDSHTITNLGGPANYDVALDTSIWLPNWDAITLTVAIDSSLLQTPPNDSGARVQFIWQIQGLYSCKNEDGTFSGFTQVYLNSTSSTGSCVDGGITKSIIAAGVGSAEGVLFASSPLGVCNGCSAVVDTFKFDPRDATLSSLNTVCTCVTGGTAPYYFSLAGGRLPSGMTLNSSTGCIDGTFDGRDQGTGIVTINVRDATGASASVTCNVIPVCAGNISGNVGY